MKKILFILLFLISTVSYSQKPIDIVIIGKVNADLLEKLMLEEINIYRKSKRLQPLTPDSTLFKQSRKHSEWMDLNKKIQHSKQANNNRYFSECCFLLVLLRVINNFLEKVLIRRLLWFGSRSP